MAPRHPTAGDWLRLLGLTACWGSAFLFNELALAALPPPVIVSGRIVLGGLLLLAYARATGTPLPRSLADWAPMAVIALFGVLVPFYLTVWAQVHLPSAATAGWTEKRSLLSLVVAKIRVWPDSSAGPAVTAGMIEPQPTGDERILLVDDEPMLLDVGRQMLELDLLAPQVHRRLMVGRPVHHEAGIAHGPAHVRGVDGHRQPRRLPVGRDTLARALQQTVGIARRQRPDGSWHGRPHINAYAALALLDRAVAETPEASSLRYARAMLLVELDRIDGAVADFEHIVGLRPDDPTALTDCRLIIVAPINTS